MFENEHAMFQLAWQGRGGIRLRFYSSANMPSQNIALSVVTLLYGNVVAVSLERGVGRLCSLACSRTGVSATRLSPEKNWWQISGKLAAKTLSHIYYSYYS